MTKGTVASGTVNMPCNENGNLEPHSFAIVCSVEQKSCNLHVTGPGRALEISLLSAEAAQLIACLAAENKTLRTAAEKAKAVDDDS